MSEKLSGSVKHNRMKAAAAIGLVASIFLTDAGPSFSHDSAPEEHHYHVDNTSEFQQFAGRPDESIHKGFIVIERRGGPDDQGRDLPEKPAGPGLVDIARS
jgi:hypothetical protein